MTEELTGYATELKRLLDKVCGAIDGLTEAQLNWTPDAPETNSAYVIARHALGNAEAWVLGIACGQPVDRDRDAEFRAAGPDAAPLIDLARKLSQRIDDALAALAPAALDEPRDPPAALRGVGPAQPLTARQALMLAIDHAATHVGEIQLTRALALNSANG